LINESIVSPHLAGADVGAATAEPVGGAAAAVAAVHVCQRVLVVVVVLHRQAHAQADAEAQDENDRDHERLHLPVARARLGQQTAATRRARAGDLPDQRWLSDTDMLPGNLRMAHVFGINGLSRLSSSSFSQARVLQYDVAAAFVRSALEPRRGLTSLFWHRRRSRRSGFDSCCRATHMLEAPAVCRPADIPRTEAPRSGMTLPQVRLSTTSSRMARRARQTCGSMLAAAPIRASTLGPRLHALLWYLCICGFRHIACHGHELLNGGELMLPAWIVPCGNASALALPPTRAMQRISIFLTGPPLSTSL